ncbi:type II secretion system F family protein [Candidatus Magnetaquicoccus inordinatus]|uniref:type II secretion system F family protein n=1 Tax=Candidatus Magnetaquicoccus inordinatus TaxID=2496818 RepID=UPI00102B14A9|nr:type II secretion system F family protein [Candidatus Magnetaquicoccus inordinatus]
MFERLTDNQPKRLGFVNLPIYVYKAVKLGSREIVADQVVAADRFAAARQLREKGLTPLTIQDAKRGTFGLVSVIRKSGLESDDLIYLSRELATLVDAGMDVGRAIRLMAELSDNPRLGKSLRLVMERIHDGDTLSKALESQPENYPPLFVNMVRAGEVGGNLAMALGELSSFLERAEEIRSKTKSALVYPYIMLFMMGGSLAVLFGMVLPQFEPLFKDAGDKLPFLTQILMGISHGFRNYGKVGFVLFLLIFLGGRVLFRQPKIRKKWHLILLNSSLVGDVIVKFEVARFSRTFATLMKNGVETMKAMSMSIATMGNLVLAEAMLEVQKGLSMGDGLSKALEKKGIFPSRVIQLLRIGEETGQLNEMLERIGSIYEKEVERGVARLMALLTPAITIGLGILVALIVASILITVLSVNKLAF